MGSDDAARLAPRKHRSWPWLSYCVYIILVGVWWLGSSSGDDAGASGGAVVDHGLRGAGGRRMGQRFLVVGDWGSSLDDPETWADQRRTASAMVAYAAGVRRPSHAFVLSVGDQAYPHGVDNVTDATARFARSFFPVYGPALTKKPWHLTLGNHDCQGSPEAAYLYASSPSNPFHMEPYYVIAREAPDGSALRLFSLDACTLVCGKPRPAGEENFRCDGVWADTDESRLGMLSWLEGELRHAGCRDDGRGAWCVVSTHWPVYSFGGNGPTKELQEDLVPIMERYGVAAYFSGHDHNLQHIVPDASSGRAVEYFVSGGGGYRLHPGLKPEVDPGLNEGVQSVFRETAHGFASVEVSKAALQVTFVSDGGVELYHTSIPSRGRGASRVPIPIELGTEAGVT